MNSVRSSSLMNLWVFVAHFARNEHHLVKNTVHGGAVACCFVMAHRMIQFVWTADQAKTPAGVVSVAVVSVKKICEMSTLKHSWMILKACLTKVHSCMQCAIVSKE